MSVTKEQRAALQAAGYTVKGNTVLNKAGDSVGGYNENGKIWSGSGKVTAILKSSPTPTAAPTPKQATKKAPVAKPVAKSPMKGYQRGDVTTSAIPKSGRGDGGAERVRRAAEGALSKAAKKPSQPAPKPAAKPAYPTASSRAAEAEARKAKLSAGKGSVTKAEWAAMSRAERARRGLPVRPIDSWFAGGGWKAESTPKPRARARNTGN